MEQSDETSVLITRIAEEHSYRTFGYLNRDDLKNEIWVICLEQLKNYNTDRGELENFLRVAVKTRLINRFKDINKSVRSPCTRCPFFKPGEKIDCGKFGTNKYQCNKWKNYTLSVISRNSLLNSSGSYVERSTDDSIENQLVGQELINIIENEIDQDYRYDLQEFINGGKMSKQRQKRLKNEILKILENHNIDDWV